jgi:hypothetical protein
MDRAYCDASFYEFSKSGFGYYALIWAVNIDAARSCYEEYVCELDDDAKMIIPTKLSFLDGARKIIESPPDGEYDDSDMFYTFKDLFLDRESEIILMDGSLA